MGLRLSQHWRLLAFATACLTLLAVSPALATACRRRLVRGRGRVRAAPGVCAWKIEWKQFPKDTNSAYVKLTNDGRTAAINKETPKCYTIRSKSFPPGDRMAARMKIKIDNRGAGVSIGVIAEGYEDWNKDIKDSPNVYTLCYHDGGVIVQNGQDLISKDRRRRDRNLPELNEGSRLKVLVQKNYVFFSVNDECRAKCSEWKAGRAHNSSGYCSGSECKARWRADFKHKVHLPEELQNCNISLAVTLLGNAKVTLLP